MEQTQLTSKQLVHKRGLVLALKPREDRTRIQALWRASLLLDNIMGAVNLTTKFKNWYIGLWEERAMEFVELPLAEYTRYTHDSTPVDAEYWATRGEYVSLAMLFNNTMRKYRGDDYKYFYTI